LRRTYGLGGVGSFLGKKKSIFFNQYFDDILHYILYYNNIHVFTAFVRKLLKNKIFSTKKNDGVVFFLFLKFFRFL